MVKLSRGQILFIGVVVIAAALAAFAAVQVAGMFKRPKYVAVYLETGELYFGTMRWFPTPRLSNAVLLQRAQDGGWTLTRFTDAAWRPVEPMRVNRDKIVFWTYVDPASPITQVIEGRVPPAQPPSSQTQPQVQPTPTPRPTPTPEE